MILDRVAGYLLGLFLGREDAMGINWDIARRVRQDFGEQADDALALLAAAKEKHPNWANRLLRCAVQVAHGDLERLKSAIRLGESDWRDLIVAGEYATRDGKLQQARDLNRQFRGKRD